MKERIINEILMQMEPHVDTETLRILETVIIKALYYVEVQKKETDPSTTLGFYAAANGEHLRQVHNRYMSIGA